MPYDTKEAKNAYLDSINAREITKTQSAGSQNSLGFGYEDRPTLSTEANMSLLQSEFGQRPEIDFHQESQKNISREFDAISSRRQSALAREFQEENPLTLGMITPMLLS